MITEKDVRRAIRLAIKAKQIEKNPIIYEEESFGININDTDIEARAQSPFYDKLKTKLDIKSKEIEAAKKRVKYGVFKKF